MTQHDVAIITGNTSGSIRPVLERFEAQGLVVSRPGARRKGKPGNPPTAYQLTPQGRVVARQQLYRLEQILAYYQGEALDMLAPCEYATAS